MSAVAIQPFFSFPVRYQTPSLSLFSETLQTWVLFQPSQEIGKGQMKISKKYGYGAHFYESLNTALKAVRSKDTAKKQGHVQRLLGASLFSFSIGNG